MCSSIIITLENFTQQRSSTRLLGKLSTPFSRNVPLFEVLFLARVSPAIVRPRHTADKAVKPSLVILLSDRTSIKLSISNTNVWLWVCVITQTWLIHLQLQYQRGSVRFVERALCFIHITSHIEACEQCRQQMETKTPKLLFNYRIFGSPAKCPICRPATFHHPRHDHGDQMKTRANQR